MRLRLGHRYHETKQVSVYVEDNIREMEIALKSDYQLPPLLNRTDKTVQELFNATAFPFISTIVLKTLADHHFNKKKKLHFDPEMVKPGDIVHTVMTELFEFMKEEKKIKNPYILITTDGAQPIPGEPPPHWSARAHQLS